MKKTFFFMILICFVPFSAFTAMVTEEILESLDFSEQYRQECLAQPDTSKWHIAQFAQGNVVRYAVIGDIVVYDAQTKSWWRLLTPVSTKLPVETLAFEMRPDGTIKRYIKILVVYDGPQGDVMQVSAKAKNNQETLLKKEAVEQQLIRKKENQEQKIHEPQKKSQSDFIMKVASVQDFINFWRKMQ